MSTPHLPKADLRRQSLALRAGLAAQAPEAAAQVADRVLKLLRPALQAPIVIAGYVTIGSELDCRPSLAALAAAGATLVLPVTAGQGERLQFRAWRPGEALEPGPFGTFHPGEGAPVIEPDLLLLPLLAFDKAGHRLGYGAGYYDRTLAALRAGRRIAAIGIGYEGQLIQALPAERTDQLMDAMITETDVRMFNDTFAPGA